MTIYDPKVRDCIEENSSKTFHCNTTCAGVYADVQWVAKDIDQQHKDAQADESIREVLEGKIDVDLLKVLLLFKTEMMKQMKSVVDHKMKIATGERGQELDKKKYKMLISEYRKFKTKNVKHFRFNSAVISSRFGKPKYAQQLSV